MGKRISTKSHKSKSSKENTNPLNRTGEADNSFINKDIRFDFPLEEQKEKTGNIDFLHY